MALSEAVDANHEVTLAVLEKNDKTIVTCVVVSPLTTIGETLNELRKHGVVQLYSTRRVPLMPLDPEASWGSVNLNRSVDSVFADVVFEVEPEEPQSVFTPTSARPSRSY